MQFIFLLNQPLICRDFQRPSAAYFGCTLISRLSRMRLGSGWGGLRMFYRWIVNLGMVVLSMLSLPQKGCSFSRCISLYREHPLNCPFKNYLCASFTKRYMFRIFTELSCSWEGIRSLGEKKERVEKEGNCFNVYWSRRLDIWGGKSSVSQLLGDSHGQWEYTCNSTKRGASICRCLFGASGRLRRRRATYEARERQRESP